LQVHDWQAIVKEHGPSVWQTAYRLLANHSDTADCFQETFLAALEISRHQRIRSMPGLLQRLATTRAIDRLRQRARQERRQTPGNHAMPGRDADCGPSDHAQRRELAQRLRQAVGQLPPQEAKAFCLRYFSEMSYRQIARELHMRTNAAGVLLHRAKARLRGILNTEHVEMDEVSP
jgi:RNA polymerase sigma-70 factor (ECF subfamily)